MQGCNVYHFHDTSPTAGFKQAKRLSLSMYLNPDASNLAPFLLYLKKHHQTDYQEIISAIKTVAPSSQV